MNRTIYNLLQYLRRNPDLYTAAILAFVTSFFIRFSITSTIEALNLKILLLLLCLMLVVASFKKLGVLSLVYMKLCSLSGNARSLSRLFIFINFFISMLITNDVSLIIFIPIAIAAFVKVNRQDLLIKVLSLQTVAANVGSTLTPIGNPQNLFIYTVFNYDLLSFLKVTFPIILVSFVLLFLTTHFIDTKPLKYESKIVISINSKRCSLTTVLFVLCLLSVLSVLDVYLMSALVLCSILIMDMSLFKQADYKLLLLFVFLFIFVNNVCQIETVKSFAENFVDKYEYFISVSLSQIVSNVPATVMLSNFAKDPNMLLIGVNVGGLGTIIASMASLITFKFYIKTEGATPLYYMKKFTKYNIGFLLVLVSFHFIFPQFF
ncbi:MAG: SLC13 family permease [Succinatimonas sp.]|nr:SLC13 family permease [Succinatimonas sp.]